MTLHVSCSRDRWRTLRADARVEGTSKGYEMRLVCECRVAGCRAGSDGGAGGWRGYETVQRVIGAGLGAAAVVAAATTEHAALIGACLDACLPVFCETR